MIKRRTLGRAVVYTLVATAAVATAAFLAYRAIFTRPGEAAIRYIPQDALFVATLDTNPGPNQIAAFQKLRDQLQQTGADKQLEQGLSALFNNLPVPTLLRPHVRTNLAIAAWGDFSATKPEFVFLCDVDDPKEVESILSKNGKRASASGFSYYEFNGGETNAAVVREYLVLGPSAAVLQKVYDVSEGKLPSLTTLNEYQQARKALPEDSNLMVFVAPKAFSQAPHDPNEPIPPPDWIAYGIAIRDDGVLNSFQMPLSSSKSKALQMVARMKDISGKGLEGLPEGAISVTAFGQPGEGIRILREFAASGGGPGMDEDLAKAEQEWGVKMDDLINDLSGNAYLAVYPGTGGIMSGGFNAMISIEAANGEATLLADRIRQIFERSSDGKSKFTSYTIGDLSVWMLDPASQKLWRDELTQGFFPSNPGPSAETMAAMPPEYRAEMEKANAERIRDNKENAIKYMSDKTIAIAAVDGRVLIGSSAELMDQAIELRQDPGKSMSKDGMGQLLKNTLEQPAQVLFSVNVGKIVKEFEPEIRKAATGPQEQKMIDGLLKDIGGDASMIVTAKYDGSLMHAEIRAPLHIGLSAVPVMAAITFPVFAQAKVAAKRSSSLSNLKQVALAAIMWSSDNDDKFPTAKSWTEFVKQTQPYTKNIQIYQSMNPAGSELAYNTKLAGLTSAEIELFAATPMLWEVTPWPDGRRGVAFTDGHAKMVTPEQWAELQKYMDPKTAPKTEPSWMAMPPGSAPGGPGEF